MVNILVLCTANRCRSVMAEALIARRLGAAGILASVRSAGLVRDGDHSPTEVISAMAEYGIDVSAHRSTMVRMQVLKEAHLVMGMTRAHVRHAVVAAPETWPRAFTLKEFVRRAAEVGQRVPGEPFARWLERIHDDRDRLSLLGDSLADDVADPMGGPMRRYAATAAHLDDLASHFVELCAGSSAFVDLHPLC